MSGFYSFTHCLWLFSGCIRVVMIVWLTEPQDTTSWSFTEEICQAPERRITGLEVAFHGPDLEGTFSCSLHSIDSALCLCSPCVPRTLTTTLLSSCCRVPPSILCCKPHPGSRDLCSASLDPMCSPNFTSIFLAVGVTLTLKPLRYNLIPSSKPDCPSLPHDSVNSSFRRETATAVTDFPTHAP